MNSRLETMKQTLEAVARRFVGRLTHRSRIAIEQSEPRTRDVLQSESAKAARQRADERWENEGGAVADGSVKPL